MIFLSLFLISLHKCVKHNHVLLVTHPETYTLCHWGNVFSSQKSYFHIFTSHSLPLFFGMFFVFVLFCCCEWHLQDSLQSAFNSKYHSD